jgi:hypothetical protein
MRGGRQCPAMSNYHLTGRSQLGMRADVASAGPHPQPLSRRAGRGEPDVERRLLIGHPALLAARRRL